MKMKWGKEMDRIVRQIKVWRWIKDEGREEIFVTIINRKERLKDTKFGE